MEEDSNLRCGSETIARTQKEKAFLELAERFRSAKGRDEVRQLGDQMGRFMFGE